MSSRPDSFMPLYIADYLGDTSHLIGCSEHGAYLLLIMHYFRTGKPLPADDAILANIAKCTKQEWMRFGAKILGFFQLEGTFYKHKRIDEEISNAIAMYERRKSAALASHHARRVNSKGKAGAKQLQPQPQPQENGPTDHSRSGVAAARAETAAPHPTSEPDWTADHERWASFKTSLGQKNWDFWFKGCRLNGSETTLIAPTTFRRDELGKRYYTPLETHFGEPVTIKVADGAAYAPD